MAFEGIEGKVAVVTGAGGGRQKLHPAPQPCHQSAVLDCDVLLRACLRGPEPDQDLPGREATIAGGDPEQLSDA